MRSLTRAALIAFFAAGLAACFSSYDPPPGTVRCSSDPKRPCPNGYVCANQLCVFPDLATPFDAGAD